MLPPCEPCHKNGSNGGFSLAEEEVIEFDSTEMIEFIRHLQRSPFVMPRTYVSEFPFFIVIDNFKRTFCLGARPEDLVDIDTINKRIWKKHSYYLYRLAQFPLDKAEYYQRLKEVHAVKTVRGLSKITGEDWSYIAKILRLLHLPGSIKDFLRNHKNDPVLIKFFTLRRLLEIVGQGEEGLQMGRFREFLEQQEKGNLSEV
jgi:hypothetical protein